MKRLPFFIEAVNHCSVEVIKFLLSFGKQYNKTMCTATLRQQQKEQSHMKPYQDVHPFGYHTSLSNLLEKHEKLMGGHFTQTQKKPWHLTQETILMADETKQQESVIKETPLESYSEKARLVRQIEVKISLLESKSKQPGIKDQDLQPIGDEIYNKFDQYFIRFGNNRPQFTGRQKGTAASNYRVNHSTNKNSEVNPAKRGISRKKQHSLLSQSSISRIKPSSSKVVEDIQPETTNKKMYNTTANLSIDSQNDGDQDIEERPFFETKMDESQLEGLNHNYESQTISSHDGDNFNESYIQLKENIRVMEERIAFLIHRLQQNKNQISSLKQINKTLQQRLKEEVKAKKDLRRSLEDKNIELINIQEDNQIHQAKIKKLQNQKWKKEVLLDKNEKEIILLKEDIQFSKKSIADKQNKISHLEGIIKSKAQEITDLTLAFANLEKEQENKLKDLFQQIEELEKEKINLKETIKDYKLRFQVQGLSFNYDEANKLKRLIEESEIEHQKQISEVILKYKTEITALKNINSQMLKEAEAISKAVSSWMKIDTSPVINPQVLTQPQLMQQFLKMVQTHNSILSLNKQYQSSLAKSQDRVEILKQQCQQKFIELKTLISENQQMKDLIEKITSQKQQLVRYLRDHVCSNPDQIKEEERESKLRASKMDSRIIQIKLCKAITEETAEMTLEYFLKKKMLTNVDTILRFALKIIDFSFEIQANLPSKKKFPSLAPHSILLSIKNLSDLEITFSIISKKEEEEGLFYQAPQVVLGFNQSSSSHCWTIGLIIDELLHGRKLFRAITDILSHKDNYVIYDEKYKKLSFLNEMIKKNHKVRISLETAQKKIIQYLDSWKTHK